VKRLVRPALGAVVLLALAATPAAAALCANGIVND
jgi:hypothetical protein